MKKIKIDLILLISVIGLSLFGLLMVYSSSYIWAEYKYNDALKYFKAELLFMIIGFIILFIATNLSYKNYLKNANVILGICVLLLILVLIPGIGTVRNGSRSWFGIGSFGIQPSEFVKIGLIIWTSKYLVRNQKIMKNIKSGVGPLILILFIIFGLIMLQPDFGTGTVLVISILLLLFISGVKINFFIGMGILGIIGVVGLIIIAPYRMQRIISYLNPWSDPLGSGFQIIQSLYAIGPGGLLGLGLGNSIQKHFYLPEPQTDFIFSIISEELGFMGVLIVTTLFGIIIYRGIKISINSNDLFAKYLSFGIIIQLSFQTLLNLMVVVGLIPVTGVTLPFLSYGGSSLLVSMVSIGIVLNISKNNN